MQGGLAVLDVLAFTSSVHSRCVVAMRSSLRCTEGFEQSQQCSYVDVWGQHKFKGHWTYLCLLSLRPNL